METSSKIMGGHDCAGKKKLGDEWPSYKRTEATCMPFSRISRVKIGDVSISSFFLRELLSRLVCWPEQIRRTRNRGNGQKKVSMLKLWVRSTRGRNAGVNQSRAIFNIHVYFVHSNDWKGRCNPKKKGWKPNISVLGNTDSSPMGDWALLLHYFFCKKFAGVVNNANEDTQIRYSFPGTELYVPDFSLSFRGFIFPL